MAGLWFPCTLQLKHPWPVAFVPIFRLCLSIMYLSIWCTWTTVFDVQPDNLMLVVRLLHCFCLPITYLYSCSVVKRKHVSTVFYFPFRFLTKTAFERCSLLHLQRWERIPVDTLTWWSFETPSCIIMHSKLREQQLVVQGSAWLSVFLPWVLSFRQHELSYLIAGGCWGGASCHDLQTLFRIGKSVESQYS